LSGKPVFSRVDLHLNTNRVGDDRSEQDGVSARWTGYFTPTAPGEHIVFVEGPGEEGGLRFYLDDKLVIDNWELIRARVSTLRLPFVAGAHKVRLEYFVHGTWGGSNAKLGIIRPEAIVSANAKTLASRADALVLAVGFDSDIESEGGDRTFQLPPGQEELINQLAASNKNSVAVITSGGAVDMNAWLDHVPALFEAWYSGQEAGTAFAQLLFGDYSPSGKLPVSFERRWEDSAVHDSYYPKDGEKKVAYTEDVFLGYRHFDKSETKPLFPFGFGLSYTTFSYSHLSLTPARSSAEPVTVSFDVTNSGQRSGAEIAEVYVGEPHAKVERPLKELKGFAKLQLNPGETRHVSLKLDRRAFSYFDVGKHGWSWDDGDYNVYVGPSSAQIDLSGSIRLSSKNP
jgi:beta-glucosidase